MPPPPPDRAHGKAGRQRILEGNTHQLRRRGAFRGADPPMWSPHALAKRPYDLRAPLRNRTVDLLLTIEGQRGRLRSFRHVNGPTAGCCSRAPAVRLLHLFAVPPPHTP